MDKDRETPLQVVSEHDFFASSTRQWPPDRHLDRGTIPPPPSVGHEDRSSTREGGDGSARSRIFVATAGGPMWEAVSCALAGQYEPVRVAGTCEAIDQAILGPPDAILADATDPLSGACDELLQATTTATQMFAVPIVLVSNSDGAEVRSRLLRAGAHDFILTPFSRDDLCARVANAVAIKRVRDALGAAARQAPQSEPPGGALRPRLRDVHALAADVSAQNRELQAAIGLLEIARDRAISSSKIKSNMLNLVSHELRTPLTGLRLLVDHLQRSGDISDRGKITLRKAAATVRRIEALVDSLLEHVKIDAGKLAIQVRAIDLKAMALELLADVEPLAEQRHIRLALSAPPVLPTLRSDERLVWMILSNLIANAIKYTTPHGHIEVALAPHAQGLRLAVIDTGPGIPPEHMKRVFRPFERAVGERAVTPGVGLGLALVMEMVSALDGRLELQSEVGVGSTFVVTLPQSLER